MSGVSIFHNHSFTYHFLTFHAWFWQIRMWPCGLCVGVTTVMPLHRPLSAQSQSVIHSTSVPSNYTAYVLFPVTVLQLTQIPPSSTDCLQIWQGWASIINHLYGICLTCNCSVYCILPKSVCILLQINIHEHLHYWYFISSWNQIGILHWHRIPMSVMVLPGPIITNIQNPPYLIPSHDNFLSNSLMSPRHTTRCNRVGYIIIKIMNTQNCFASHETVSGCFEISLQHAMTKPELMRRLINYCEPYWQQRQNKLTCRQNTILSSTPKFIWWSFTGAFKTV